MIFEKYYETSRKTFDEKNLKNKSIKHIKNKKYFSQNENIYLFDVSFCKNF